MHSRTSRADGHHLIAFAALLATYLQAVNISLPNAAILHLEGALSMTDDELGWTFTSYIAASSVVIPMTPWLAGRFGRKTVLLGSLALFAIGLVLDMQAATVLQLVGARAIQGAASGPIAPLSLAILLEDQPLDRLPRLTMISTVALLVGILSGPAVGGWITEYHGWRAMFAFGLPVTCFIFLAMALFLSEKKASHTPPFDFFGLAMLSLGLVGLQMLLDRGERVEWFHSTECRLEAAAAALGFCLYAIHIWTSQRHFLNKALFADRNFALSTVMFFAFGFVLLPTLALTSPMLEELLGYPADTTGYMAIPRGAALVSGLILASRAPKWFDTRLLVVGGIALVACGNGRMLDYTPAMDWQFVVVAGAIQGLGLGILMFALNKAAFSTLHPTLRPEGTALFNLARLYGSTLGIAIVQILFFDNTQAMHQALAAEITPYSATGVAGMRAAASLASLNDIVTEQAAFIAVIDQFKLLMIVILAVSPLALFLRKARPVN